jgi:hypothetical protein
MYVVTLSMYNLSIYLSATNVPATLDGTLAFCQKRKLHAWAGLNCEQPSVAMHAGFAKTMPY